MSSFDYKYLDVCYCLVIINCNKHKYLLPVSVVLVMINKKKVVTNTGAPLVP
jgi:hypothetical protein